MLFLLSLPLKLVRLALELVRLAIRIALLPLRLLGAILNIVFRRGGKGRRRDRGAA